MYQADHGEPPMEIKQKDKNKINEVLDNMAAEEKLN